jgi:protein-disulfide isomerase
MATSSDRSASRGKIAEPSTLTEYINKYAMTVLLVVAAFVIGVLFTEVRYLKKGYTGSPSAGVGTNTGTAPSGPTLAMADLLGNIGVDADDVYSCYQDGGGADRVASQMQAGTAAGVTGTPGNFVVVGGNQGELIAGALPFASMKTIIDDYLQDGTTANTVALPELPAVNNDDYVRGPANARVTIVEYSDFDCPFCNQFHSTMNQIMAEYPNDVRWVYRHYPLTQLHPNAENVARISECVQDVGGTEKFWEFADEYFGTVGAGATVTI